MKTEKAQKWNVTERFETIANMLLTDKDSLKRASDSTKNTTSMLNDIVLKVIVNGTLKDKAFILGSMAKDKPFYSIRSVKSRANTVVNYLLSLENQAFQYTLGKGDKAVTYTVSIAEIKEKWNTDDALSFNLTSAERFIRSLQSNEQPMSREDAAIAEYLAVTGINEKDFKTLVANDPAQRVQAINEGLAFLVESENNQLAEDARHNADTILSLFEKLPQSAKKEVLANLNFVSVSPATSAQENGKQAVNA